MIAAIIINAATLNNAQTVPRYDFAVVVWLIKIITERHIICFADIKG